MKKAKVKISKNRYKKFVEFKELPKLSAILKSKKKKIVFTLGAFDLLNPGHCRFLAEAKSQGHILIVGVSTDHSVSVLKGDKYPLMNQEVRAELITYLDVVDYVVYVDEANPLGVLSLLKPDIFFTSIHDWRDGVWGEHEEFLIDSYGGKIIKREKHLPYLGTTGLIEHIANIRVLQVLESYLKNKVNNFNLNSTDHLKPAEFKPQRPMYKKAKNYESKIVKFSELSKLKRVYKKSKYTTIFVSGSYDLFHIGHARFIEQAGILGDKLIVGIPSDKAIRGLKGIGRPVISEYSRAYVLSALDLVDHVVIFEDIDVINALIKLQPDIFFTVDESWNSGLKDSKEYKYVKSYGGDVALAVRQAPFLSSSAIINKVAGEKIKEIFDECLKDLQENKLLKEESRLKSGR